MIIGKLFLSAVDGLAFLGTQYLLTVGRPKCFSAYLASLLTEGVISFSAKRFFSFSAC